MATRSLNKVLLIGNVVRDPELRYTPQNTAVCTFTVATNRSWTGADGSNQESTEFTRIVTWSKLAEIINQIIKKGRKVYVEGRLQTREWEKDGAKQRMTEVVADEVIALDSKPVENAGNTDYSYPSDSAKSEAKPSKNTKKNDDLQVDDQIEDLADDIPF